MPQVVFDYTAYNEQGRRIDSTYGKGQPARTRVGIQGLIPGAASKSSCINPAFTCAWCLPDLHRWCWAVCGY